ncbi:MAG: radical SAM protein, partial [Phycisphaerae bacterium]
AYRNYPGDERVVLYRNIVEKLVNELARKRRQPPWVYLSPSSDPFGPYALLQETTYRLMELLLEHRIGLSFLTKGVIPPRFFALLQRFRGQVHVQVGLTSADETTTSMIEPAAASPAQRLANIQRAVDAGLHTTIRLDPLIPTLTDTTASLQRLLTELSRRAVRSVSASYLFLRPAIRRNLGRELPVGAIRSRILRAYHDGVAIVHRGATDGQPVLALAPWRRRQGLARLRSIAATLGIDVRICGCKNADLGITDRCDIGGPPEPLHCQGQLTLFARQHLAAGP